MVQFTSSAAGEIWIVSGLNPRHKIKKNTMNYHKHFEWGEKYIFTNMILVFPNICLNHEIR